MFFGTEPEWLPTDTLFEKGKNIGLTENEYRKWQNSHARVLEVGTGTRGSALKELLEDKIDCIGLEPGILYKEDDNYSLYETDQLLKDRVAPLNACDAMDHPDIKKNGLVDYVFAQSANFATYTKSKFDLINQILGLIFALKRTRDSYLTFEVRNDDLRFSFRGNTERFNLKEFLLRINARYYVRTTVYGTKYLVIYRIKDSGKDIVSDLEKALH